MEICRLMAIEVCVGAGENMNWASKDPILIVSVLLTPKIFSFASAASWYPTASMLRLHQG